MGNLWSRWSEFVWSTSTLMKNDRKYTACDSPECVRCHRYQEVRQDAWGKLQQFAERHGWSDLGGVLLAVGEGKRYRNYISKLSLDAESLMPAPKQNPNVLFVPTLSRSPWWDNVEGGPFEEVLKQLTETTNFQCILQEFLQVFKDISEDYDFNSAETTQRLWTVNDTENGKWSVFHLYNQGQKVEANCERCPVTCRHVEGMAKAMTGCLFGNVSFSVLYPGTHITEHCGPCNVRIRCHLGLQIPEGCLLKVGDEERPWTTGQCLLFDDSFQHCATNSHQDTYRAVLLVDLWHPDLKPKECQALRYMF